MSDPLAALREMDEAPGYSYASKVLRFGAPDYLLPDGTIMLKVQDAEVGAPYASCHRPTIKGLGGQSLMVVKCKDPLRLSWGIPQAEVVYYSSIRREWSSIDVPHDYPLRTIIESERLNYERVLMNTSGSTVRENRGPTFQGQKSGRGMMEAWGFYFNRYIKEPGGRQLIVDAMKAEFPERAEKVERWVDAYKSYFNLGRLPGTVKQVPQLGWIKHQVTSDPLSRILED